MPESFFYDIYVGNDRTVGECTCRDVMRYRLWQKHCTNTVEELMQREFKASIFVQDERIPQVQPLIDEICGVFGSRYNPALPTFEPNPMVRRTYREFTFTTPQKPSNVLMVAYWAILANRGGFYDVEGTSMMEKLRNSDTRPWDYYSDHENSIDAWDAIIRGDQFDGLGMYPYDVEIIRQDAYILKWLVANNRSMVRAQMKAYI